ncbi:MAG TPA: hypothetical protein VFI03_12225 [Solirubrobacterales bacterium]|nr:hypothetical protein [Solirubrobacterales bacterium]
MSGTEGLVLNPVELVPERVELDLQALGLEVRAEGLDYGESSVQVERVRRAIGEGVTDRRWPSVECNVPLIVRGDGDVPLAEAAHKLEATVARIQHEGRGGIRRDFDDGGGFAGSVVCPVDAAGLTPIQGWLMAHRQVAPDVTLKLSRYPIWYATVEQEGTEVKASGVRDLKWEIANMLGSAPGLIRVRIKNENTTEDLRGLISSIESRDYSSAATADLVYEAEKLTPLGGASVKEGVAGASGGKAVEHAALTGGWLTILGSQIVGVGHMTHTGVRRMKLRVLDPSASVGTVQLRLEWRALGATGWSSNRILEAPLVGDWALIDLGECRPERAVLGDQRWEWRLTARAPGGAGSIRVDRVYPLATEQMLAVSTPNLATAVTPRVEKSAGKGEAPGGEGGWSSPENIKSSNNTYASAELSPLPTGPTTSTVLSAKSFGYAIPETATILGIAAEVERAGTLTPGIGVRDLSIRLLKAGVETGTNKASSEGWPLADAYKPYGASNDLWGTTWTPTEINASGFGLSIMAKVVNTKIGGGTAKVDHVRLTVYYAEAGDENRVCFATRSIELRTDGVHRQHPTDDVWGRLIEEGFLHHAPPAGLEGRMARGIVIATQGDLGDLPDAGTNKLSVKPIYRPGYLFAREAA